MQTTIPNNLRVHILLKQHLTQYFLKGHVQGFTLIVLGDNLETKYTKYVHITREPKSMERYDTFLIS